MLAKSLEKMGVSYRLLALGVGDFISFLFDVGYGFVVICFTKRTLAYEQGLYKGFLCQVKRANSVLVVSFD